MGASIIHPGDKMRYMIPTYTYELENSIPERSGRRVGWMGWIGTEGLVSPADRAQHIYFSRLIRRPLHLVRSVDRSMAGSLLLSLSLSLSLSQLRAPDKINVALHTRRFFHAANGIYGRQSSNLF